jgi:DNA-binding transcriptional LysR family regulator
VDLDAVRTFVAVADAGQFSEAAADLAITQQIDASFRAVTMPGRPLPGNIRASWVFDEPIQIVTGPGHAFASARAITPAQLAGHRIWMPGIVTGTEWAAYYDDLAATFGLTIERVGPNFGIEALFDTIAESPELTTFVGEQTPLIWPLGYALRRITLRDPAPVYPHSLLWREGNPHPALGVLREHLAGLPRRQHDTGVWVPAWAQRPAGAPPGGG